MKIVLNSPDREAISRFVADHAQATAGHQPAWCEILRRGMGHRPLALSGWRDGQVIGYLPLVLVRSVWFGRYVVSLPYVNEAGVLADEPATTAALVERATALGRACDARSVELRNRRPINGEGLRAVRTDKMRMTATLSGDEQQLWRQIHSKARNQVRKAGRFDMTVRFGGQELLGTFYRVFARNMRDLGTPVFPRKLFAAMLDELGDGCELCVVEHAGRAVAAAVLCHFRDTTEVPSASSLRRYNHTCANMLMYWQLLRRAQQRGARRFDFGRSSENSGTYRFKKQWGATGEATGWQQIALRGQARPLTKEDDQFALAIRLWRRLPVWLTRIAGPPIVRGIP